MSSIDSTLIGSFSSHVVEVKARDWIFSVGAGGSLSIDIRLGHSTLFALSAGMMKAFYGFDQIRLLLFFPNTRRKPTFLQTLVRDHFSSPLKAD
jgi:hypothetical protein